MSLWFEILGKNKGKEAAMPGHGDHWSTLYDVDNYIHEGIVRDCQEATLVCKAPCKDVKHGTERSEEVVCLRRGSPRLANQILLVSDSIARSHYLFSAYPVVVDGISYPVTIRRVEPWEHGIEGWIHAAVTNDDVSVTFFDTMYFNGSATLQPGSVVEYSLAGLAYRLAPIRMRSFAVRTGALWEMERQRRLEGGESEDEADRPVDVHMTGAAIFLPSEGDQCDEAQFQGVIEAIDVFDHDDQKVYRLEMVLMRPGDDEFRLPVYVSERVLEGYVPRLGDDVEGAMWVQGRQTEAAGLPAMEAGIESIIIE
jgi:hypothetical protein